MPIHLSHEEIDRSHRWHAVECNNLAWSLSDQPQRTPLEDEQMLDAAHASTFHWAQVGTELHRARGHMLLAHVHAALGDGRRALSYAQQSYDFLLAHAAPDWEVAFAHAILAHAALAAGETELYRRHYAQARQLGEAIADPEEREIFFKTFDGIPAP